jgi:hypothetical protein
LIQGGLHHSLLRFKIAAAASFIEYLSIPTKLFHQKAEINGSEKSDKKRRKNCKLNRFAIKFTENEDEDNFVKTNCRRFPAVNEENFRDFYDVF